MNAKKDMLEYYILRMRQYKDMVYSKTTLESLNKLYDNIEEIESMLDYCFVDVSIEAIELRAEIDYWNKELN